MNGISSMKLIMFPSFDVAQDRLRYAPFDRLRTGLTALLRANGVINLSFLRYCIFLFCYWCSESRPGGRSCEYVQWQGGIHATDYFAVGAASAAKS